MLEDIALLAEVAGAYILDLVQNHATDLGADDIIATWPTGEGSAHTDLREPCAIEGCIVEIADTVVPRRVHGRERFLLRDVAEHVAERCRAEAQPAGQNVLECHTPSPSLMGQRNHPRRATLARMSTTR